MHKLFPVTLLAFWHGAGCADTTIPVDPEAPEEADADTTGDPDLLEVSDTDGDPQEEVSPPIDVIDEADADIADEHIPDTADDEGPSVEPNLSVSPCTFVFADNNGRDFSQSISLVNGAEATAEIRAIEIPESATDRFSFESPELPFELGPGEAQEITMRYRSGYPGEPTLNWAVRFAHGEEEHSVACSTRQDGPSDTCPLVDLELSVVGDPLARRGPVVGWAAPLDTIRLEVSETGPERIETALWRLEFGPNEASRTFSEAPDEPGNPMIRHYRVVTPGAYALCFEGTTTSGSFCEQCADVGALAPDGIWTELFWDVEIGNADLDLHAVRMSGAWFDEDADAWAGNPGDAWGDETSGLQGADEFLGPEAIAIREECRWFALGVHHVAGDSPARPTLYVYSGSEYLTSARGPLLEPGDFWDAARAHWPGGRILTVNDHVVDAVPGEFAPDVTDSMIRSGLCDTE